MLLIFSLICEEYSSVNFRFQRRYTYISNTLKIMMHCDHSVIIVHLTVFIDPWN